MKNYSIIFLILIIFSSTLVTAQSQQQFAEIGTLELVSGEFNHQLQYWLPHIWKIKC